MLSEEQEKEMIEISDSTYITKEELLKIIESIDFKKVKSLELEVITGYRIRYNDNNTPYVQTLGSTFKID